MKPVICVSIAAGTNADALRMMERAYKKTDIVELRIDRMQNADLKLLIGARQGRIIITNRRRGEGGGFAGSESERMAFLNEAVLLGADYVDVEMETEPPLLHELEDAVKRCGESTRMILSWHDFRKTPSDRLLRARLNRGVRGNGGIVKIVPYANAVADNLRILNLITYAAKKDQAVIAFCMGEKGRLSRLMSPYFGSVMNYATLEETGATAPGQMTVSEMQEIFNLLGK
jgi:3-dehydroquinate dehydratase type I